MFHRWRTTISFLVIGFAPFAASSQGPITPRSSSAESSRTYANSTDGLRLQLNTVLDAARQGNAAGVESLIKQMEIPDAGNWFAEAYGSERGPSFAAAYSGDLPRNQGNLDRLLHQLTNDDGEFSIRDVNESPTPGMEERMLDGLQRGTDIFLASWKNRGASPNFRGRPVGYFVFADGSFRLIRAFDIMPLRPASGSGPGVPRGNWSAAPGDAAGNVPLNGPANGPAQPGVRVVSWPTCDYCPSAEYSDEARKRHLEGSVLLQVMVQPDGSATDIQVVKSPDPELSQMAIDGVSRWRFKPALDANGEAVPYKEPVEMTFRLPK